jgi:hypothetical protein
MVMERLRRDARGYGDPDEHPLGGYARAMSVYAAGVAGLTAAARAAGVTLPERISGGDIALISVATHKVARMIAKDPVTSPLRAPFTSFEKNAGDGEVNEQVRGHGTQHAVGELLTCPFCLAQWVATGFAFGLVVQPRATRLAATVFAVVAAADALQLCYAGLQRLEG